MTPRLRFSVDVTDDGDFRIVVDDGQGRRMLGINGETFCAGAILSVLLDLEQTIQLLPSAVKPSDLWLRLRDAAVDRWRDEKIRRGR